MAINFILTTLWPYLNFTLGEHIDTTHTTRTHVLHQSINMPTFASIHKYSEHLHSLQWVVGPHGQSSQCEAALSLRLLGLQHSYQTVVLRQLLGES